MTHSNETIGIIGLGVMGLSLARNMHAKGITVIGYDTNENSRQETENHKIATADSLASLLSQLESPRRILIMVPAGDPVDAVLNELLPLLDQGDSVVDGGNSFFEDTARREAGLNTRGIHYLGLGVSGGRRGALEGPGMMAGGSSAAWSLWQDTLEAIAAQFEGKPCVDYLGSGGAGHYVKMVHNGIEYAMMQVLAEAYALLNANESHALDEISRIFKNWGEAELGGYLTAITADILSRKDASGTHWIQDIKDNAQHKGTGTWTVQNSLELGIPVPGIDAAVRQRQISAHFELRHQFQKQTQSDESHADRSLGQEEILLEKAVYGAQMLNYIQGLHLLQAAKDAYGYSYLAQDVAAIWRGGCIISSKIVEYLAHIDFAPYSHPLLAPAVREITSQQIGHLRQVVSHAALQGISVPALSANLDYWNSFSNTELPTSLIQAQRDYFGGHGLELRSGKKTSLDWEGTTSRTPDSD